MDPRYKLLKAACYSVNITMAVVGNLPPILFLTFRSLYGLSYSLLGLLILISFFTQLGIDLIFSLFSHRFNITKTIRLMPVLAVTGLVIYAVSPLLLPQRAFAGLVTGTLIFSASAGLAEVLISPIIASIPSDNPDREMSKTHSVYAWGAVGVIITGTAYILTAGYESWQYLVLALALIPAAAAILFARAEIPKMKTPERVSGALKLLTNKSLILCVTAIFLGGAAECTMAQWASGYLEQAMGIPKVWGDIFGAAMFAAALGLGRSMYSARGRNIGRVIFLGAVGAVLCYLAAAISPVPVIGLIACALTGFCVSMMWPGSLIISAERVPDGGVFVYAMMAAGGDLGASVAPMLVGVVTDAAMKSTKLIAAAQNMGITPEQAGMKTGMLFGMLFPLAAIPLYFYIWKKRDLR